MNKIDEPIYLEVYFEDEEDEDYGEDQGTLPSSSIDKGSV